MSKSKKYSYGNKWKEDLLITKDVCFECGSTKDIEYHHIVPEIRGGTKTIPLCIVCHGKVHDKDFIKMRQLAKIGIKKAKERGVQFGRPFNSVESEEDFLAKEKTRKILELLSQGKSLRKTANAAGCSINLVVKVKRLKGVR